MRYAYKTNSIGQQVMLWKLLESNGYTGPDLLERDRWVWLSVDTDSKHVDGYYKVEDQQAPPDHTVSDFNGLIELLSPPSPVIVRLNDKYNATVFPDKIVVGCQTFPITIAKDLLDAVTKVTAK